MSDVESTWATRELPIADHESGPRRALLDGSVRVIFLGTAGSAPSARRSAPALLLKSRDGAVLVDCGEGCTRQLLRAGIDPISVDAVFLTHLHADHYLGLPGLCAWLAEHRGARPLRLIAPSGWESVLRPLLLAAGSSADHPVDATPLGGPSLLHGVFDAFAFPVAHVGRAFGFVFTPNDGKAIKIVVSGDTAPCHAVEEMARDATLLVHDATFCDDEEERAWGTGHSTAAQAAALARRSGARSLALVHLSSRHPPSRALAEARRAFADARLPRDLDVALAAPEGAVRFLDGRDRRPVR